MTTPCACDQLIGKHDAHPSSGGLTLLEHTEEPDRYSLILYSSRYRCDKCQREQTWYWENHEPGIQISRR